MYTQPQRTTRAVGEPSSSSPEGPLFDRFSFDRFGEALRFYREQRGVSLSKLAEVVGVNVSYICNLECGERSAPSYRIVVRIGFALALGLAQLNTLLVLADYDPLAVITNYRPTGRKHWGPRREKGPDAPTPGSGSPIRSGVRP